jgi:hypothetical protein
MKSWLEPPLGFEPRTYCLQNSCSTTELRWLDDASKCSRRRYIDKALVGREGLEPS